MRIRKWLIGIVLIVAAVLPCSAMLATESPRLAAEQLVYPGATLGTRIEVSGAGAAQLIGGALEAYFEELKADAKAAQEQGVEGEASAELTAALSAAEPMKEILKSLLGVTLLVMKPGSSVQPGDFIKHYQGVMNTRGWSSLAVIQDGESTAVVLMLAPGGKGIFAAVHDGGEIVSGFITTSKPLGDLVGKFVHAGAGSDPMDLVGGLVANAFGRPQAKEESPTPPAPEEQEQAPSPEEKE